MMARDERRPVYRFGEFRLDLNERQLRQGNRVIPLQPKTFQALLYLAQRHGHLVTKEELHDAVWGNVAVTDSALARCIVDIRKAIGDSATEPRFVQTVARVGYRFVGEVEELDAAADGAVTAATEHTTAQSVVVLPFLNLSSDVEQEYFVDGFTDLLIAELGRIRSLHVISRTSAMCYKATAKTLPEIARELRVDAAVEGSVLRSGSQVRITVQLIAARSDRHLWADSYQRDLHDILQLQRDVALAVTQAIHLTLSPQEPGVWGEEGTRVLDVPRVDPEAHEAYLKGCFFWHKRMPDAVARSVEYYHLAIARDPMHAAAHAGLAHAEGVAGFFGYVPPGEAFSRMRAYAAKALAIDGHLSEAHAALAAVSLFYDWEWTAAERGLHRALQINPSYALAHEWYGWCLLATGRTSDALVELERARQLDPLSPRALTSVATGLYFTRQHQAAIERLQLALELDPGFVDVHCGLGLNHEQLCNWDEAIGSFRTAILLAGRSSGELASLGHAYGLAGQPRQARELLSELERRSREQYVSPVYFSAIHAGLADRNAALEWLDRAYCERSSWLVFVGCEPWWDPLRGDPRFDDLVRRVGVPQPRRIGG
jgi:TolB-like protein/tetratricopeptide (TPR) repeat protein